jgi:hypothetical protein
MTILRAQYERIANLSGDARQRRLWSVVLPLCAFAGWMVLLVPKHEPWADEAQAWQLARLTSVSALLRTLLHLEMSPGLWYALLRAEAAVGITYTGMHWATAAIGMVAVFLLLWRSPFPLPIRIALPFTYFLVYQYPIVARSYSLAPVLLFLLAVQWDRRQTEPLRTSILLALLANLCAQTLMIAIGFGIVLAIETWQQRARSNDMRRGHLLAAGIMLCAAIGFGLWCCYPPPDAPWVMAVHTWKNSPQTNVNGGEIPSWQHRLALLRAVMKHRDGNLAGAMLAGSAHPMRLALPVWLSTLFLFWRQRTMRYLWPIASLAFFGTFTRFSVYHRGLMWLLLLNLLWISWPAKDEVLRRVLEVALALCVLVQLSWSLQVTRDEVRRPYAPSADAAPVLAGYRAQGHEVVLAITPPAYFSVGLQPYFANQPFANLSYPYWPWLGDPDARERYVAATNDRRAIAMVIEFQEKDAQEVQRLLGLGYQEVHHFCASNLYPSNVPPEKVCYTFYEPPTTSEALSARP